MKIIATAVKIMESFYILFILNFDKMITENIVHVRVFKQSKWPRQFKERFSKTKYIFKSHLY